MSAQRFLGVAAALPLLLVGAAPAAAADSDQAPAPVQILPLTTSAGQGTAQLGEAGGAVEKLAHDERGPRPPEEEEESGDTAFRQLSAGCLADRVVWTGWTGRTAGAGSLFFHGEHPS